MQTIHLTPDQVPAAVRGDYTGRKFKAEVRESVTVPADAGQWSGGSRDRFHIVRLADGYACGIQPGAYNLNQGFAIVRESVFQGRPMGLTIYVGAADVAPLLPQPDAAPLDRAAHVALAAAGQLKSGYRIEAATREGIGRDAYAAAVDQLMAAGLLNRQGAITTAGRNRLGALPRISL